MYHRNNYARGQSAIVRAAYRKGLTLPELIISIAIMVMIAGAMAVLSNGVQSVAEHTQGLDLASQHGRIAMSRIDNNLRKAFANESFPGVFVLSTTSGSYTFPDTLFIWRPDVAAANPAGLPMVRELVVYTPDATSPNNLLEVTWPSSSATCPATSDVTSWSTLANNFRTGNGPVRTVLTNMLRSNPVSANSSTIKGAIRFRVMMQPDATDWAAYRAGTLSWSNLDWPQDLRGSTTGTRIVACQTEMQLLPTTGEINNSTGLGILPMFSSSSISYSLNK